MKLSVSDQSTGGDLLLLYNETNIDRLFYTRDFDYKYFTIAWNRGEKQTITIDGAEYDLLPNTILPLLYNQSFYFERASDVVAWQFNREFYCIIDHDSEVSCVGFLFGMNDHLFIDLDEETQRKLQILLDIFIEELKTHDDIQNGMLVMLLKRLITMVTKLARAGKFPDVKLNDDRFHILRKFNLLVEMNFHTQHSVSYYAGRLNKSPKTLSNLFALYNYKTPIQIIQERILIEAKRLLFYTDKSAKQITYELGFEDAAYFSNFFKKHTSFSPTEFRNSKGVALLGK
ncbi:MAG: AraC family transcriptional regulator [Mucilaginibacter sp.]|uniref:helix-turn-helix domain-containing protein n=1 Tax=Mucilaginibacter sp. TaxID=1882438 RepID=UPI0031B188B4